MKLLVYTQVVDKTDPILGFFHAWLSAFAERFEEVHVICLKQGAYELPKNVHVYSLGKETRQRRVQYVLRFYRHFWHIYRTHQVTHVFLHMGAIFTILAAPFFLMRKLRGVRFLWWKAHGHINWVGRFASFFCDEVVTSTESGFPIALAKRRIVGQAIDTTRFALPQSDQERDQKHIIFVGRVASIKHIEVFITVARVLKDDGYTFSVIGPHDDTAYAETLMHSAEGLPVTFVGSKTQQELVSLYQQASILLNTSLTHSMDKTVLEAMLCGCLPITANHAFETLLSPFGLYADTQDAARYVEMIRMNTEVPTERRAQLREEVVKVHSLDTFVDRVFKL